MTIRVTTDVFCDGEGCHEWADGVVRSVADSVAARRSAKSKGWQRRWVDDHFVDLCPMCADRMNGVAVPDDMTADLYMYIKWSDSRRAAIEAERANFDKAASELLSKGNFLS